MVSAFCFGRLGFLERFCIPLSRTDKCIIIHFLLYKTITKQICAPQTACIKSASASAEALLSVCLNLFASPSGEGEVDFRRRRKDGEGGEPTQGFHSLSVCFADSSPP